MRSRSLSRTRALVAALVICVLALASSLLIGRGAQRDGSEAAMQLRAGVLVGVLRTPAGALAAADNYLALASQSIEQDPATFAALLAQAYAPQARKRTLAEAQRLRAGDAQNMSNYREGGRGIALVAARRLDSYTPRQATVTSWLAGLVWGPHLPPRQTWNLVDTTLIWQAGRWLVLASHTDATPAPVPSIVYVDGDNDQAPAFTRLAGMSAPFYGAGG